MAQVTFVNVANTGIINGTTVAITKPTGVADGDLLIAYFGSITGVTITTLAGWTALDSITTNGFSKVFWKIASSEGSSYSWTCSSVTNQGVDGIIVAFRGTHQTAPLATYSKNEDTVNDTTATGATISTLSAPNAMLGMFVHATNIVTSVSAYAIANNNPSWTEAIDTSADGTGTADTTDSFAYANYDLAQSTGVPTATLAGAAVAHVWLLSIIPAGYTFASSVFAAAASEPSPTPGIAISSPVIAATASPKVPTAATAAGAVSNATKHSATFSNQAKS